MSDSTTNQPPIPAPPPSDEIDLIDVLGILFRYRWIIIGITGFAAVAVVAFSIISIVLPPERSPLPNLYEPEAIVLLDDDTAVPGGVQAALAQMGLPGFAGGTITSGAGYGELAVRLLRGNTIVDMLASEFGLIDRYGIEEFTRDNARKAVRERQTVSYQPETRTISIRYEDIDPVLATDIVNRMVQLLDLRFSAIGGSRNVRKRDLLEQKLVEIEGVIIGLEEEIQAFQRRYGTIDPQTYAREHITILAEMRARLIAKEIEAETHGQFARADDPVAARLRAEAEQLRRTIAEMEQRYFGGGTSASGAAGSLSDAVIALGDIPQLAIRFGRLERELRVQSRIYEVLTQQYEVARLSAEDEALAFQVLEPADVPQLKSGPSRAVLSILFTTAAFFGSVVLTFIVNMVRNLRKDEDAMGRLTGKSVERP